MKNTKKIAGFLVAFAATVFLISCHSDDPVKNRNKNIEKLYKKGIVKIAAVTSFGKEKSMLLDGIELALDEIRNENLIDKEIQLDIYEDKAREKEALTIAYQIAGDEGTAAVIGHDYSDISKSCSLIYQYYGILMMNAQSTLPSLTSEDNHLVFRNLPADDAAGREAARFCRKNDIDKVIIYYADRTYGNSLANSFELAAGKYNVEIISRDSYQIGVAEKFHDRKAKSWDNSFVFDGIFLAGSMPDILTIVKCIRQRGINVPIIGADSFENPLFFQELPESENGKIFAVSNFDLESENPAFVDFRNKFNQKYGKEPDLNACQGYDALMVYVKAVKKAGSALPEEVAKALRSENWNEAAGPYTFNARGEVEGKELTDKVLMNGKLIKK